jgi:hypothetical protein
MSSKSDKSAPGAASPSKKEARLAEALRANLRRRKAQAMARRQPDERPDRG